MKQERYAEAKGLFSDVKSNLEEWKKSVEERQEAQAVFQKALERQHVLERELEEAGKMKNATGTERKKLDSIRDLCSAGAEALQEGRTDVAGNLFSEAEKELDAWRAVLATRAKRRTLAWCAGGTLVVLLASFAVWYWRTPLWSGICWPFESLWNLWKADSLWLKGIVAVFGVWGMVGAVGWWLAKEDHSIVWAEGLGVALTGLTAWWLESWIVCLVMAAGIWGGLWGFKVKFLYDKYFGFAPIGVLAVVALGWGGWIVFGWLKQLWVADSLWLKGIVAVLGAWGVMWIVLCCLADVSLSIVWAEILAVVLTGLAAWWLESWIVCLVMAVGLWGGLLACKDTFWDDERFGGVLACSVVLGLLVWWLGGWFWIGLVVLVVLVIILAEI